MSRQASRVPVAESEVTSEWLSAAMGVDGIEVEELERLEGNNPVVSQLFRAYISFGGEPLTVVVKLPAFAEDHRRMIAEEKIYQREVGTYQLLSRWQGSFVPRLLAHAYDETSATAALVMEDVGPPLKGFETGQVSVESAEIVLERLAEVHAAFWGGEALRGYGWMRPAETSDLFSEPIEKLGPAWRNMLASGRAPVGQKAQKIGERLVDELGDVMARLRERPQTLIHADLHQGNLMFRHRDRSDPVVIDWGNTASCGGTSDIAKFIATSLKVEDLVANEGGLLRSYHDALTEGGVDGYPFGQLTIDYRRAQLATLANYVIANHYDEAGPDVPETSSPSLHAVLAAVDAVGELA